MVSPFHPRVTIKPGVLRIHGALDNRCKGSGMPTHSATEDSEDMEDSEDSDLLHNASAPVRENSGLASYAPHYTHCFR